MGDDMRGVQESQDGEVECHLVQPVGCCTSAAVSLELLWLGWLGWLGCRVAGLLCAELSQGTGDCGQGSLELPSPGLHGGWVHRE